MNFVDFASLGGLLRLVILEILVGLGLGIAVHYANVNLRCDDCGSFAAFEVPDFVEHAVQSILLQNFPHVMDLDLLAHQDPFLGQSLRSCVSDAHIP